MPHLLLFCFLIYKVKQALNLHRYSLSNHLAVGCALYILNLYLLLIFNTWIYQAYESKSQYKLLIPLLINHIFFLLYFN